MRHICSTELLLLSAGCRWASNLLPVSARWRRVLLGLDAQVLSAVCRHE